MSHLISFHQTRSATPHANLSRISPSKRGGKRRKKKWWENPSQGPGMKKNKLFTTFQRERGEGGKNLHKRGRKKKVFKNHLSSKKKKNKTEGIIKLYIKRVMKKKERNEGEDVYSHL